MKEKIHFIDCGANIGQSAKWAKEQFGEQLIKIDSFEPHPYNIAVMKARKELDWKILTLHECAVSTSNNTQRFYCQNWGARTGSSLVFGKSSTSPNEFLDMKCVDLVEWLKQNLSVENYNILKIDVEGFEYELLPHLLKHNIPDIIDKWYVEFHEVKIPNPKPEVEKLFKESVKEYIDWGKFCV